MSILTLFAIIVSFAILLALSDFAIVRKMRNDISRLVDLFTGDDNATDSVHIIGRESDIAEEYEEVEEPDEEEDSTKEELKVEIDKEVEKITEEMRHHEIIRERLERHYVTLRRVARDMIDSLISPPPYTSPNDTHIPVPVIDERPLWVDLARNHIPSSTGDLMGRWADFVDSMNKITVTKTRVFRNVENYLFSGLNLTRKDSLRSDSQENSYSAEALIKLMNVIYFKENSKIEVADSKKGRKVSRNMSIFIGDLNLVSGSSEEVSSIEAKINALLSAEGTYNVEGMNELSELLRNAEKLKDDITSILNWFIFDNSEMKMCEMVKND